MVFTQSRGFVIAACLICRFVRSVVACWFVTPLTPPLWQRDSFLVNCSMLRSLLASERSAVVETFRGANSGLSESVTDVSLRLLVGKGLFVDQGYDESAEAFIVGSATLRGLFARVEYVNAVTTFEGDEVSAELFRSEFVGGDCFLDPPHGGFGIAYDLTPGDSPVISLAHCVSFPFETCDGTVWHRYIPTADGVFTCNTFGSAVDDTVLEIYAGATERSATVITINDDVTGSTASRASFPVSEGVEYRVRIVSDPVQDLRNTRLDYEFLSGALMGDANLDGSVNLLDVVPFINLITSSEYEPRVDANFDSDVNLLDVGAFVELLTGP